MNGVQSDTTTHFNLKNALAKSPVAKTSKSSKKGLLQTRSKTSSTKRPKQPKHENDLPTMEAKKKRVYRRITPTIRNIYEANTGPASNLNISLPIVNNSNQSAAVADSNTSLDIFSDLPFVKPTKTANDLNESNDINMLFANNSTNKLEDDELELIFGQNDVYKNTRSSNGSSTITKIAQPVQNIQNNNPAANFNDSVGGNTRMLRSRTSSLLRKLI
jgi:hypothetical protein